MCVCVRVCVFAHQYKSYAGIPSLSAFAGSGKGLGKTVHLVQNPLSPALLGR